MSLAIAENTNLRTIETLISEARALGMRVVHRPEQAKSNVINLDCAREKLRMQMCASAEA